MWCRNLDPFRGLVRGVATSLFGLEKMFEVTHCFSSRVRKMEMNPREVLA